MHYLPPLAGVAVLSVLITRMLIPMTHLMWLLDRPSGRKAHMGIVPLLSGISIYLSVVISSVAFLDLPKTGLGIGLICGLVTSIGALDGRYPMHADY
jgi:UDP-GlcNAc:undecaprenyl-phosphate GlcNAc-1-phosphate transferase